MNRRWLGASILASVVAVSLAACSDRSSQPYYVGASGGGGNTLCSQYTSCGTCTPVEGCGWCFTRSSGMCASSPDECGTNEFTWTWNASGCPGVDASVAPVDGGGGAD